MACETALVSKYAGTDNKGGNAAAVFFLFLFVTMYVFSSRARTLWALTDSVTSYGLAIDNTAFVYCAEIFPTMYRAKGMALGLFVYYVSSIAFLTPAATAMQNIG